MFKNLLNILILALVSLISLSSQLNLAEFAKPLDCNSNSIPDIPSIIPNHCNYVENLTSLIQKFSPSNQVTTQQLIQTLFADLKTKLVESYSTVKRQNRIIFSQFAAKDPKGLNATETLFSNIAKDNKQLVLSTESCANYRSDLDILKSKLNNDGLIFSKQIICLVASDLKRNLPITTALFLFRNGKTLSALEQSEKANLAPLKDLMVKIMSSQPTKF